jgi:1,4-alpha-glucan branching enzyme
MSTLSTKTTTRPGMGATLYETGATFRVWAPHADRVSVLGTFNNWSPEAHILQPEKDGTFALDIDGVEAGDEYRFEIRNGDQVLSRIDPYARAVTSSVGNGIIFDPSFDWNGDTFTLPPQNELVIYELHIGTFRRSSPDRPGTFDDAIRGLTHLAELGVNAVEVMPIAEFAGDLSWGYNPAQPFAIEQAYGGPAAFQRFVKAAHARGIAVILDVVYNHFGPSDLHLWQFDGWSENGLGGIYFYNDHRAETPWGQTRPDYGRNEVRQYIRDNAMMWLADYHVDGLRMDMTLYMRTVGGEHTSELSDGWSLCQWVNEEVRTLKPHAITIAEDLQDSEWLTKPASEGGAGFTSQWDARFVHPVREMAAVPTDEQRSMAKLADALSFRYNGDAFQRIVYSESHDEVANGKQRVPSEIDTEHPDTTAAQKRSTLAAGLAMTAPGIPMLFQGQEFLQSGWFRDDKGLDWDQTERFAGIVQLYKDLIALRRNLAGTTRGLTGQGQLVYHVNDGVNVIAFQRWRDHGPGDDVVVIVNMGASDQENYRLGLPADGTWRVRINSDSEHYGEMGANAGPAEIEAVAEGADGLPMSMSLTIPAYSVLILSQDAGDSGRDKAMDPKDTSNATNASNGKSTGAAPTGSVRSAE